MVTTRYIVVQWLVRLAVRWSSNPIKSSHCCLEQES